MCAAFVLAACGFVDFEAREPGVLRGNLLVLWVGEGDNLGDGRFVFVPDPKQPLQFARDPKNGRDWVVEPQAMYTDGGSIPRAAQAFQGLQPWGYAPAYMIHDWLFVAKNCRTDGMATPKEAALADMSFQDSADILAEVIQTLIRDKRVAPDDVAPPLISNVVAGLPTRALWNAKGACASRRLSKDDQAAVDALFAPSRLRLLAPGAAPAIAPNGPVARVVASYSF